MNITKLAALSLFIIWCFFFLSLLNTPFLFLPQTVAHSVFPGDQWETKTPLEVGMDENILFQISEYMGGRGMIVRYGYLVYSWGDITMREDIASAAKPIYSHFLFTAISQGKLASFDEKVVNFEPCLYYLNPDLGYKDRNITFRHMANQISDYGVMENPGTAFNYNDWQMALFWDTLFKIVYGATYSNVDEMVFNPLLNDTLQMQDEPTFLAFGVNNRPGRVAISVRDHARFGLLYLNEGNWNGRQLIKKEYAEMAVTQHVPLSIKRTEGIEADMCVGQRSLGSNLIPDDQADNDGSYSWLWWINGVNVDGVRKWPDGPTDTFAALGHNSRRGLGIIPSLDVVIAWNDANVQVSEDEKINVLLRYITNSIIFSIPTSTPTYFIPSPSATKTPNNYEFLLPLIMNRESVQSR